MQTEILKFILRAIPLSKAYTYEKLLERILEDGDRYFTNGIASEEDELDFCGIISVVLDEATLLNQDLQVELINEIYNAAGFQRFWKG